MIVAKQAFPKGEGGTAIAVTEEGIAISPYCLQFGPLCRTSPGLPKGEGLMR